MAQPARAPSLHHSPGFTLLELSIVLMIIGLLVGGIAGFRSYSRNAQLNTMMNESSYFIDAFNQFQTRYNAAPGDYLNAATTWTGGVPGDGNGLIRAAATPLTTEIYGVFQHLNKAGLISGSYTGAVNGSGGASIGVNVPGSSMDKVAFIFDHPDVLDGNVGTGDALYYPSSNGATATITGLYNNLQRIAGLNDNATGLPDQPFITPKQAYQIDDKFDDGQPGSGTIVTPNTTALPNCSTSATGYNTGNDAVSCYLFRRMQ